MASRSHPGFEELGAKEHEKFMRSKPAGDSRGESEKRSLQQDNDEFIVSCHASGSKRPQLCVPLNTDVTFKVIEHDDRPLTPDYEQYFLQLIEARITPTGSDSLGPEEYHHKFRAMNCGSSKIVWYDKREKDETKKPLFEISVTVFDDGTNTP